MFISWPSCVKIFRMLCERVGECFIHPALNWRISKESEINYTGSPEKEKINKNFSKRGGICCLIKQPLELKHAQSSHVPSQFKNDRVCFGNWQQ